MAATIIDGRAIAARINEETRSEVAELTLREVTPGLAVVLVGDDPPSRAYVRAKEKMSRQLGLHSVLFEMPAETTQEELITQVERLNADASIHGILVQSPPPAHIDERAVIDHIHPLKDVDGFHPINVGKLVIGDPSGLVPCTPLGCQRLLLESGIDPAGAHVVVVGRSLLVGKPVASLLMQKGRGGDATVTIAHSKSRNLEEITLAADILIAAIGRAQFLRGKHIRSGAVVLDVGINRVEDPASERGYRFVGDVHFEEAAAQASMITPVPGGVGPMTIAMLMVNTVRACRSIQGF